MMGNIDRKQFIGGSDTAAILGISPWKSTFQLYQEKIGAFIDEPDSEKQRVFARGKRLEPVVIEMMVDELESRGHEVEILARNERYQHPDHPFLACEIDVELSIDGEEMSGEIKTVNQFAAKDWGEQGTDELPLHYLSQVMHGLMIVPRRRAIVAALIGADDLRIHFVDRDQETIDLIKEKEIEFWKRVQDKEPPDPSTGKDVKFLYARDHGLVMDADDELASLCAQYRGHKVTMKSLEELLDELSTKIKLKMGDASVLMHEGRKIATWKNNKDGESTDWKSLAISMNPDVELIRQFTKLKQGARPFSVK
jgi:putative phage-type endonuclease